MQLPLVFENIQIGEDSFEIAVPEPKAVLEAYQQNRSAAYWARIWPASLGLCQFLKEEPHWIANKTVMELAAGLGLPSLSIAPLAKSILITDREEAAERFVNASIRHLQIQNAQAASLEWKNALEQPTPDVVLLSDVNYEPEVFEELLGVINTFLSRQCTLIISTPQRLVAKEFINQLEKYKIADASYNILLNGNETMVTVWVLRKKL